MGRTKLGKSIKRGREVSMVALTHQEATHLKAQTQLMIWDGELSLGTRGSSRLLGGSAIGGGGEHLCNIHWGLGQTEVLG